MPASTGRAVGAEGVDIAPSIRKPARLYSALLHRALEKASSLAYNAARARRTHRGFLFIQIEEHEQQIAAVVRRPGRRARRLRSEARSSQDPTRSCGRARPGTR